MARSAWGLETLIGPEWTQRAACSPDREVAELFWPAYKPGSTLDRIRSDSDTGRALAICRRCPVRRDCDQHAIDNPEPWLRVAGGRLHGPGAKVAISG